MTTAIKERPILFNGEMVRAILDGRKTQTRRVVKPQPPIGTLWDKFSMLFCAPGARVGVIRKCPFGAPGDRLWLRETWSIADCGRHVSLSKEAWPEGFPVDRLLYPATDPAPAKDSNGDPYWWNKRPSIHCPRWASRINLEVTAVRVERVQDISALDACAEGICSLYANGIPPYPPDAFHTLWDSLNAKRGYGWDENPWVWVVEFQRVEGE